MSRGLSALLVVLLGGAPVGCTIDDPVLSGFQMKCDDEHSCPVGFVCERDRCVDKDEAGLGGEGEGGVGGDAGDAGEGEGAPNEGDGDEGAAGEGEGEGEGEHGPPPTGEGEGESDSDPVPATVELTLEPEVSQAGQPITASCVAKDKDGQELQTPTSLGVAPDTGVEIDGDQLTATRALGDSSYQVTCSAANGQVSTSQRWRVEPGPVARIEVLGVPPVVRSGAALVPVVNAHDAYDNVATADVVWSVGEGFELQVGDGSLAITGAGSTELTATDQASAARGVTAVGVDASPPTLVVTAPEDASFNVEGADLLVTGRADDDVGVGSVSVNDVAADVAEDGSFSLNVGRPDAGLVLLTVVATDRVGDTARKEIAILHGTFDPDLGQINEAIRIGANQDYWSDGDEDNLPDDAADLLEPLVELPPDMDVTVDAGCGDDDFEIRSLTVDEVELTFNPLDGGPPGLLYAQLALHGVRFDLNAASFVPPNCGFGEHELDATLTYERVVVDGQAVLDTAGCLPTVTPPEAPDGAHEGGAADVGGTLGQFGIGPVIVGFAGDVLISEIEDAYTQIVGDALPTLLGSMAPRGPIPAPSPWDGSVDFATCFDDLSVDDDGVHFDLKGRAVIQGDQDDLEDLPPNAGFLSKHGFSPSTRGDHAVAMSLDDDLANSLFFDIWRSDLGVEEEVGAAVLALPPVMMTRRGAGPDDPAGFSIGFGAMRFTTTVQDEPVVTHASAIIPFHATARPDGVLLLGDPDPGTWDLRLQVVQWPAALCANGLQVVEGIAFDNVTDALASRFVADGLVFPLATIDVSSLAPDAYDPGDTLSLGDADVVIDGPQFDHLTVRGGLRFQAAGQ